MKLFKSAIGMLLEGIINPILRLDPEIDHLMKPLAGKRLGVKLTDFGLRLVYSVEGSKLRVSVNDFADADVDLSGGCVDLLRLAFAEHPQPILAQKTVSLIGDIHVLQDFQKLIQQMDLDWEGHLSSIIGPVAAHEIGELARKAKSFHKSASAETRQDITEFLQEELRATPPREEIEDFYEDVAKLKEDVERFEAKLSSSGDCPLIRQKD